MGTIAEKLNYLNDTKSAIKDAIVAKGVSVADDASFRSYAESIAAIEGGGGGGVEVEPIVLTGAQSYGCAGDIATAYIKLFGDSITTSKLTHTDYMFSNSKLEYIPFELNYSDVNYNNISYLFAYCNNLKEIPKMNNIKPNGLGSLFTSCYKLKELPADITDWFDWTYIDTLSNTYGGSRQSSFNYCFSLRSFPMDFLAHGNPKSSYASSIYYYLFYHCYALDEVIGLPFPHYNATYTSNAFQNTFIQCGRLKRITFAMNEDGTPKAVDWKNQTIDLTDIGFNYMTGDILSNTDATGITADKRVTDDATYQSLKNDPDWWTTDYKYSRYNHDSAVETLNTLPDTSAYLASAGGTNTIRFKGAAGSKTDGGAINTLTEEEIAVAAAKGWTVSLV